MPAREAALPVASEASNDPCSLAPSVLSRLTLPQAIAVRGVSPGLAKERMQVIEAQQKWVATSEEEANPPVESEASPNESEASPNESF